MPEIKLSDNFPKIGQKIVVRVQVFGSTAREKEIFVTYIKQDRRKKGDTREKAFLVFVENKDSPSLVFSDGSWTVIPEIPCQVDLLEEHRHI